MSINIVNIVKNSFINLINKIIIKFNLFNLKLFNIQ